MIVTETNVKEFPCRRGKVRDVYDIGDKLVFVTTDRISAFDYILPTAIPERGKILTDMTCFWFDYTKTWLANHLISTNLADMPEPFRNEVFAGRTMLVKKAKVIPLECIVRGYISGSGFKEYKKTGAICGITLPRGLQESMPLYFPIFTPSTKAETGHDVNVTLDEAEKIVGDSHLLTRMQDLSIALYRAAAAHAWGRGIIIADTKFEWGLYEGELILIDEVLTPDSSRYWPVSEYRVGESPPSFDKQIVRDYLSHDHGWDKDSPPPELSDEVVKFTKQKYEEIYSLLTDK